LKDDLITVYTTHRPGLSHPCEIIAEVCGCRIPGPPYREVVRLPW